MIIIIIIIIITITVAIITRYLYLFLSSSANNFAIEKIFARRSDQLLCDTLPFFIYRTVQVGNKKAYMDPQTEGQEKLPSKGPLSIHQRALFVFWVSIVCLALFRKFLMYFKVSSLMKLRMPSAGKKS